MQEKPLSAQYGKRFCDLLLSMDPKSGLTGTIPKSNPRQRRGLQKISFESGLADAVDVTGEVEHLVGEAPLIVIPCNELYKVAVQGESLLFLALLGLKSPELLQELFNCFSLSL